MGEKTIYQHLRDEGLSRRDFMKFCGIVSGMMGLELVPGVKAFGASASRDGARMVADALMSKPRLPLIWLELQDCAGCTEAISRSQSPSLVNLVLNKIAVDYQETLMAAAGFQAEQAKRDSMKKYHGQYVLVVEGSPTIGADGVYCTVGGRSNLDILREAADGAAAIIATGNCATFGGIPRARPNPTGARGVSEIIKDKPIVNIPGCPAIPEVTTGTIAYVLVMGKLPKTDALLTAADLLWPYDPRPLPAPALLRSREVRRVLRRRRRPRGRVPLQARVQGADHLQRLLLAQVDAGPVLSRAVRPSVPGLLGTAILGRRRVLPGPVRPADQADDRGGRDRGRRRGRPRHRAGRGRYKSARARPGSRSLRRTKNARNRRTPWTGPHSFDSCAGRFSPPPS